MCFLRASYCELNGKAKRGRDTPRRDIKARHAFVSAEVQELGMAQQHMEAPVAMTLLD